MSAASRIRAWLENCGRLALLVVGLSAAVGAPAQSALTSWSPSDYNTALFRWLDDELSPALGGRLSEHPRFEGESVMVGALAGEALDTDANLLTRSLVRRLGEQLSGQSGVRVVWRSGASACQKPAGVDYVVGVELTRSGSSEYRVSVRVLDLKERSWVPSTAYEWRGRLTGSERAAFARIDEAARRGGRNTPFGPEEADRLGARLAAELACQLGRSPWRFYLAPVSAEADQRVLPLLGSYLAEAGFVRAADAEEADLSIGLSRQEIAAGLELVLASARPAVAGYRVAGAEARVYQRTGSSAPPPVAATRPLPEPPAADIAPIAVGLAPLRMLAPRAPRDCTAHEPFRRGARERSPATPLRSGDCFDLELTSNDSMTVYLLQYRRDVGLVPATARECQTGAARGLRLNAGEGVRVSEWLREAALRGRATPATETYYALAAGDRDAAERLGKLVDEVARACRAAHRKGVPVRPGEAWLAELDAAMRELGDRVSWQALRLTHTG